MQMAILVLIGLGAGMSSGLFGIGGGVLIVPALVYLLRVPGNVVIGTSLFQVVFVAANVTFLQAIQVGSVDIVLTLLLLAGGVVGAQFGAQMGTKLRGEETRALLGMLVLSVALGLLYDLVRTPENLFAIGPVP